MSKFYVTFFDHHRLADGTRLADRYVEFKATDAFEACKKFRKVRGISFGIMYHEQDVKTVARIKEQRISIDISRMTKQEPEKGIAP